MHTRLKLANPGNIGMQKASLFGPHQSPWRDASFLAPYIVTFTELYIHLSLSSTKKDARWHMNEQLDNCLLSADKRKFPRTKQVTPSRILPHQGSSTKTKCCATKSKRACDRRRAFYPLNYTAKTVSLRKLRGEVRRPRGGSNSWLPARPTTHEQELSPAIHKNRNPTYYISLVVLKALTFPYFWLTRGRSSCRS